MSDPDYTDNCKPLFKKHKRLPLMPLHSGNLYVYA